MPWRDVTYRYGSVPGVGEQNPGLKNWHLDDWAGMQQYDNPGDHQTETPFYGFSDPVEDFPMTSPRTCSECGAPLLNYDDWRKHVLRQHVNPDRTPPGEPQPVVDLDDVLPAGFNEAVMDKTVQRQSRLIHQFTAEKPRLMYTAAPQGKWYFHVAPADSRESIMQNGLDAGLPLRQYHDDPYDAYEDVANYMWDDIDMARKWVQYEIEEQTRQWHGLDDTHANAAWDIWGVFEPSNIEPDMWWQRPELSEFDREYLHPDGTPSANRVRQPIPAADLELIETHLSDGAVEKHNQHFGAAQAPAILGPIPGQKIWRPSLDGQHLEEWEWRDG